MSVRTDTVNLIVNVNGNKAQNDLINLKKKAGDVTAELRGLKKGTEEYIQKSKELATVNKEMDALKKTIGITALSQKELTSELNKLKALRGSVIPFSQEYKDLGKQIEVVEKRLYDVRNGTQGFASMLSKVSDEVKQFGVLAAAYLGFEFISSQFQNIIKGAGKLSDQLADLRRVAGLTAAEAGNLNEKFKTLDTRTTTDGLREIAIIAGKLGVAKDDIFDFTAAVDQLVVSLGDELGNADQITTQLGKILNVFNGEISADGITKLGNAFVELANTGSATGGFIADFDQRLSGIAKSSGIGLGALSGLGAGLEEMGAKVESSSTAIQKLIVSIASNIPAAAKIAGQSTAEFNKLFTLDPTEALLKYSEGLVKNKKSFAEVTASLADAGEEGARTIETISKLGEGANQLRARIDLGKQSIEESTAITEAFRLKNETFGATLDKLGKEFNKLTSSSAVNSFLQGAAESAFKFIQVIKGIPQFLNDNSTALKLLVLGIVLMNGAYIKSAVAIAADTILKVQNAIATRATAIATAFAQVATSAYIVVTNLLTGRIGLAIAAQRLWAIALTVGLGPLGIIVTLVGAAVVAFNAFTGASNKLNTSLSLQAETYREANKEIAAQKAQLESMASVIKDSNTSQQTKEDILKRLIALSPEYLRGLTLENIATAEGKRILDTYNKSLENTANIKAASRINERETEKSIQLIQIKQELEIFRKTKDYSGLGDEARSALQLGSGADNIGSALTILQSKIDAQSALVKNANSNFVSLTQKSDEDRRAALLQEITLSRQAQNIAKKQLEDVDKNSDEYNKRVIVYEKATLRLKNARAALDKESGSNKPSTIVGDVPEGKDDKKAEAKAKSAADKAAAKDKAEYDRLIKEAERFQASLQKIKDKAQLKSEAPDQAEIDAVTQKYAELIGQAEEYYSKQALTKQQTVDAELLISEAEQKELNAIKYRRLQKDAVDEEKIQAEIADTKAKAAEKQRIIDEAAKEKAARGRLAEAQLGILEATNKGIKAETEARVKFRKEQYEQDIANENLTNAEKLVLKQIYEDDVKEIESEGLKEKLKGILQYVQFFQDALTGLNQILNNKENAQFNKEKANNEKKKRLYKDQLDNRLISKEQYDKKIAATDEEMDRKDKELKLKQAKRERALNIFQAVINTASAIVEALPNVAMSIIAGVLGGIQIAAIASEPLPQFGTGDWIRTGDKHSDRSGGINAKIERDEAVISAGAMTNQSRYTVTGTTAQITSALNSRGGGASWATGAVVQMPKWMTERPATINPNMPRIMAQGGLVVPLSNDRETNNSNGELAALLIKNNQLLQEQINVTREKQEALHAVVSIKEYRQQEKLFDQAQKVSGLS